MMNFILAVALTAVIYLLVMRVLWDGFIETERRRRNGQD